MTITKDIATIRDHLYHALDSCGEDEDTVAKDMQVKLDQKLRITDKVLRNGGGVTMIAQQNVSITVVRNLTKALQGCDNVVTKYAIVEPESPSELIVQAVVNKYLSQGLSLKQFRDKMGLEYIKQAERISKNKTQAADTLGASRGAISFQKDKLLES